MPPTILRSDTSGKRVRQNAPQEEGLRLLWTVIAAGGLAISTIGWSDLVLLWVPLKFGNVQWEFATIGAHLIGMPLGTMGFVLLVAGAVGRGWWQVVLVLAVAAGLVACFLVAVAGLYALTVPVAFGGTPPEARAVLTKAVAKSAVFLAVYLPFYGWMAGYLWKVVRRRMRET